MFLGYHVIKTRTDTHKKKVRNLEERHANLVMDLDQMQWVAWKRLLSFENMGAFLLRKRYSLPNPRVMIHQPLGGAEGGQTDIDIQANEMLHHKADLNLNIFLTHAALLLKSAPAVVMQREWGLPIIMSM
ncbi:hypothetical protein E1A91_D12G074300v1 [Gossypium mustelinum]|uniref:Endopeptidase Clp n=1 Tax=Gossypium mustelinum TaxID=34275 RepID=A0A5D2SBT3_GOSMU|nr:hypothetical protein E1A91_D12G074300v1 [Gossypium mustelinum]